MSPTGADDFLMRGGDLSNLPRAEVRDGALADPLVVFADLTAGPPLDEVEARLRVLKKSLNGTDALRRAVVGQATIKRLEELHVRAPAELVRHALAPDEPHGEPPTKREGPPYQATDAGIVWRRPTREGAVPTPLTNFTARIIADIVQDDGAGAPQRMFEIEATLSGRATRFAVPATHYSAMTWPTEYLGAGAYVLPGFGLKDHARAAIQVLSGQVPERRVFTHTGWRRVGVGEQEQWVFLHVGGAIGASGTVSGVNVELPGALARYRLPDPPTGQALVAAIRADLRLLGVSPRRVTASVLAGVYRAVMGPTDFSLHIAGQTGAGKTELAALAQQHFGLEMNSRNLPAGWASTGNSLESLAFQAKDALLVVDDFAPAGTVADVQRLHRDADRLLRAQGNAIGRQRMNRDSTLRRERHPRGLVLSTGEDVPRGQSLRARLFTLELGPSDLDWHRLDQCQQDAAAGFYAQVVAAFIRWLAPRYDEAPCELRAKVLGLRAKATHSVAHRRTPEIVANLAAGLWFFLDFARQAGAITLEESAELWASGWGALGEAAELQAEYQGASEPTRRFLELLRASIASGRSHVANPSGEPPPNAGAWGWKLITIGRDSDGNEINEWRQQGDRVGWLDEDHLYLEPDASYAAVQRLGRDGGEHLSITQRTLHKRLHERGQLVSTEAGWETLTVRKTLQNARRRVLHLHTSAIVGPVAVEPGQPGQEFFVVSQASSPGQVLQNHTYSSEEPGQPQTNVARGEIGGAGQVGQVSGIDPLTRIGIEGADPSGLVEFEP